MPTFTVSCGALSSVAWPIALILSRCTYALCATCTTSPPPKLSDGCTGNTSSNDGRNFFESLTHHPINAKSVLMWTGLNNEQRAQLPGSNNHNAVL
jgi:hypothetical protein